MKWAIFEAVRRFLRVGKGGFWIQKWEKGGGEARKRWRRSAKKAKMIIMKARNVKNEPFW